MRIYFLYMCDDCVNIHSCGLMERFLWMKPTVDRRRTCALHGIPHSPTAFISLEQCVEKGAVVSCLPSTPAVI